MGCPCFAQNNIIKAKEIDLSEKEKIYNEVYTCVNILTTSENNLQDISIIPNNYLGKAKENILKHSKDKKLKEKVKKRISVKSPINYFKSNHKSAGPIISFLESRYKNLSKKNVNINQH